MAVIDDADLTHDIEQMEKAFPRTMQVRGRVVHGWAFRNHTAEEVLGILRYLAYGNVTNLPERYRANTPLKGDR